MNDLDWASSPDLDLLGVMWLALPIAALDVPPPHQLFIGFTDVLPNRFYSSHVYGRCELKDEECDFRGKLIRFRRLITAEFKTR
jgi:hypothetical protein